MHQLITKVAPPSCMNTRISSQKHLQVWTLLLLVSVLLVFCRGRPPKLIQSLHCPSSTMTQWRTVGMSKANR
jgi:predicted alpha/beta hydrolase